MSNVYRNDIYVRSERGGEWFEDLLRSLANSSTNTTQDILDSINQKRGETIESVVNKYRKMVGLDIIANDDTVGIEKEASFERPLSKRHAKMMDDEKKDDDKGVILIIENNPKLKADVHSILEGSGGQRNTHAIINFLRKVLGNELVSYSDDDLINYLDDMKSKYQSVEKEPIGQIGHVGTEDADYYDDGMADFVNNNKVV